MYLLPSTWYLEAENEERTIFEFFDLYSDPSKNFNYVLKNISKWIIKKIKFNLQFVVDYPEELSEIANLLKGYAKVFMINITLNWVQIDWEENQKAILLFLETLKSISNMGSIIINFKNFSKIHEIKKYVYSQFSRNIYIKS